MKVFLTGATGFVGSYILQELIRAGHDARCLVRGKPRRLAVQHGGHVGDAERGEDGPTGEAEQGERGRTAKIEQGDAGRTAKVEQVEGDVSAPSSLRGTMDGCDAVIHLVGIIEEKPSRGITFEAVQYEGTKAVVNEARRAGVRVFVQMSANGARSDASSRYHSTKWKAEQYVAAGGFEHWTVFRPSIIFGDPGPENPEFASMIARKLVRPFPVLPVFGTGDYLLQPVSIQEVAAAFVQALDLPAARDRIYCAAGKDRFTFNEVLDRICDAVGHARKPKIPVPLGLARPLVHSIGRTGLLPISPDQFDMLVQGNTCDGTDFYRDFEVEARPFSLENLTYLRHRR